MYHSPQPDPRFPGAINVRPLPYPLVQQPMVLRPAKQAYGAVWTSHDWDDDDLYAWVPVPRIRFVVASAVLGAAAMAVAGKTSNRSLVLGAAGGVLSVIAISAATTRD